MTTETIFLGIILGFIYYELVGLTPGGIVVPGYIALYMGRAGTLATTLLAALITLLLVVGLSRLVILYGRRAFLAAVMISFGTSDRGIFSSDSDRATVAPKSIKISNCMGIGMCFMFCPLLFYLLLRQTKVS